MSKPMTRQEWLSYLGQTWDAAQKTAWSEQPREWVGLELSEMDEIIDGNMTITNSKLRDAVYAVVLDTMTTLMEKNT